MRMRGLCVALLICGWSVPAFAAATVITMTPNPVDTGTTVVGMSGSASGTLSSNNNVHVDLQVGSCSGTGNGTFSFDQSANVNLNNPVVITVTYMPSQAGARQCNVNVYDTGTTTVLGTFAVRGNGINPAMMSVSGNTDFSSVRFNDAAPVHTFNRTWTVTNTGDVTLNVTNVSISGTDAADFAVTVSPASGAILGGNSKTWTITFNPSASGTRTATLTFTSDAPSNGTQNFTITGIGTNAVIAVSDPAFGIVNVGNSANQDITVTNNGGAPKGPLGVTSAAITGGNGWFAFSACGGGTSCTFLPALSINSSTVVGVKCTPTDTSTQTAMVTFTSDTDSTADQVATLTCTGGQSKLATNMTTVQFAPSLVGTTSSPLMVTVTNTGNVDATIWLSKTGANAGAFTVGTTTGCGTSSGNVCTVPANNGTQMVTVTVTPGFEGDVSAGLTLNANAPPNPTLVLAGRGIDRHVSTVDSVQFPDTFRNPGDKATVMPISVKNIGEYPLHVSNIAIDGMGIWALADTFMPFDVPGLSQVDVNVKFMPMTAGKAPDATLVVFTDDTKKPQSNIVISGNGKDRNVAMGPPVLDFGNTGAGVPVTYTSLKRPEDWLTVVNMDDTAFKVREIKFDMPDVFHVENIGGGSVDNGDLAVGASNTYEVIFTPPKVGEYTANMTLFLDQDPTAQRTVEVRGNALFVDAHGGGGFGCSTGNGAGGGTALALLALLRRKRPRAPRA